MKTKKIIGIALIVVAITLIILAATYARYITEVTGEATATTAKWVFSAKADGTSLDALTINLYDTLTEVDSHVDATGGKKLIAPGAYGEFELELSAVGSEVDVVYTIALTPGANIPTGLKFYTSDAYTTEFSSVSDTALAMGTTATVDVFWAWDFDAANANNDTSFNAKTFTADLVVTGKQATPSTTLPVIP